MSRCILILIALITASCAKSTGPQAGSQTHFLQACEKTCQGGYSCVCGVCTLPCTQDAMCSSEANTARCVEPGANGAACESEGTVCDVECDAQRDCAGVGKDFVCTLGRCRANGKTADAGADSGEVTPPDLAMCPGSSPNLLSYTIVKPDGTIAMPVAKQSPLEVNGTVLAAGMDTPPSDACRRDESWITIAETGSADMWQACFRAPVLTWQFAIGDSVSLVQEVGTFAVFGGGPSAVHTTLRSNGKLVVHIETSDSEDELKLPDSIEITRGEPICASPEKPCNPRAFSVNASIGAESRPVVGESVRLGDHWVFLEGYWLYQISSACDGSPAGISLAVTSDPPATTPGCVTRGVTWGMNGGLVASSDSFSIAPCREFSMARTYFSNPDLNMACNNQVAATASMSIDDLNAALADPDVAAAIAAAPVVYGFDSRTGEGPVFQFTIGNAVIDVGVDCGPLAQSGCVAVPAGLKTLVTTLTALSEQQMKLPTCDAVP